MANQLTIKQNDACKLFKDVYVDFVCIGTVMASNAMTAKECYLELVNNWNIDSLEAQSDEQINRSLTY